MFIGRALLATARGKRKRNELEDHVDDMAAFFSTVAAKAHIQPPPAPFRKPSQRLARPDNDLDDFLSSDLELSFASTMSLNSAPASPEKDAFALELPAHDAPFSPNAMDISPAPKSYTEKSAFSGGKHARPRAFTVARVFGRELSNQESPNFNYSPASVKDDGPGIPRSRSPLPAGWMGVFSKQPKPTTPPPEPEPEFVDASDAMDMDMDMDERILPPELTQPTIEDQTVKLSANPGASGYSTLFFDELSPERPAVPMRPRKRRSLSPQGSPKQNPDEVQRLTKNVDILQPAFEEMQSSPAPPSPSAQKLDRFASTGGGLFGRKSKPAPLLGLYAGESASGSGSKRGRRPTISALSRNEPHALSAYPILDTSINKENGPAPAFAIPPARRAFSGTVPSFPMAQGMDTEVETEGESDAGPEFSSPAVAAYVKRQNVRTVRRRDGTDDFRPLTGVGMQLQQAVQPRAHSPLRKAPTMVTVNESPSSRWVHGAGLPGFGDNEAHGKVLPCERVPEDGLMRIDTQTLDALIAGKFDDKVASYQIIDCRFDYEYQGGHIKGAVNISVAEEIEEYLLGIAALKPAPSCSGDATKKTVLIFHCEFSAKRAPTFAKHIRSKDRAMNNHVYPKIHYPEVYILKGGYSQYYSQSAMFSEPRGYVRMDDPQFASDRRQDLDQFRTKSRFVRTRSYAFGESAKNASGMTRASSQAAHQRNAASCGGAAALYAGAPRSREREWTAPLLCPLDEDVNASMVSEDSFAMDGVDKSPCPPPTAKSNFFGAKGGSAMLGRPRRMQRAQTYSAIR